MIKRFVVPVCMMVSLISVSVPVGAQAATAAESLARMDVVIAEMQKLRAEFALLVRGGTTVSALSIGSVLGASASSILTDDLSVGVTNESITKIQTLLATDEEIYADGTVSGFFGPKTQEAVRNFQVRFGLDPVGVVGPSTKAILEAFMAKYPNDTYPIDVLKGSVPQVATTIPTAPSPTSPVVTMPIPTPTGKTVTSISLDGEDDEVLVTSRNSDGTRNRDLILYPDDEEDLVSLIASKLKISEALVESLADLDDANLGRSSKDEEEDADDALSDADDAISEAEDAIEEAEDDGDDVSDAKDVLDEAYDALDEAEDAFDEEEYEDAIELAEEAADLAEEAIDEL
jgi:hypothetical protein